MQNGFDVHKRSSFSEFGLFHHASCKGDAAETYVAARTRSKLTVAVDGEQALALLFAEEEGGAPLPNLILLDWSLPKVSANEMLRRMKRHAKFRRIPILVFFSSEADSDIHEAYDNHANGYIAKPGNADVLAEIVETIGQFWVAVAQLPKVMRQYLLEFMSTQWSRVSTFRPVMLGVNAFCEQQVAGRFGDKNPIAEY